MSIEINAKDVMKLRNQTGLSMMECKRALTEAGGDFDKAEEILRKAMKGKMDAKTDRAAGEGRVAISISPSEAGGAIVEVRAETDFTAKNEKFIAACQKIADMAVSERSGAVEPTAAMKTLLDEIRISTGENCSIARVHKLAGAEGRSEFAKYVHHDGKTGVLIQAEGSVSEETLRQICMHVTAAHPRPQGISANDIPRHILDKERNFRIAQAMESGKPKEIAEKMVEGGMRKFFEEVALLEQPFVMDPTKKIKDLIGPKASIVAFLRWQVGEQA